ncbi:hypothetical protein ACIBSW_34460 [Actinoplanes sp. NPDC049668]|uniref:hypothetical protein n=1 Tax=unclassified Actinoplanes TaxID=2626549 RepID=UPI0033B281E1
MSHADQDRDDEAEAILINTAVEYATVLAAIDRLKVEDRELFDKLVERKEKLAVQLLDTAKGMRVDEADVKFLLNRGRRRGDSGPTTSP